MEIRIFKAFDRVSSGIVIQILRQELPFERMRAI